MESESRTVHTIPEFLSAIEEDYASWETAQFPWFRGEPGGPDISPLMPKVYRPNRDGKTPDENALLQFFRMRAPILGLPIIPSEHRTDQWLFLARHMGLPTRILDWTEGALIALYFALLSEYPVVWMLNPQSLNAKSLSSGSGPVPNAPTLTWVHRTDTPNIYSLNIRGAWELDAVGTELPVAVHPTNIHPRMTAQHSCFTIHGKMKRGLSEMVGPDCLRRYEVDFSAIGLEEGRSQLRRLGISHSTLFPEPEGLAKELEHLFWTDQGA